MDPIPWIQTILADFPTVNVAVGREYLAMIDSYLNMVDVSYRPVAAGMLRTAAASAANEERRTVLLEAAAAIEAVTENPFVAWEDDPVPPPTFRPAKARPKRKRPMTVDQFRAANTRKASILQLGGFTPTFKPTASNFGLRPLGLPGEKWPTWQSRPLLFVCQMNLTEAPVVPPLLEGIQLLTFFVDPGLENLELTNGGDWVVRTYTSLDGLVPIPVPAGAPKVKNGFECRWAACDDYPTNDDPDVVVPEGMRRPRDELDNVARTKIGGYASLILCEHWWDHWAHPSKPKFCVQINSEEQAGVIWDDWGAIYLARGTARGRHDQWFLDWQCF
jgi:Domain of unknown function (DUF1963)